MTTIEDYSDELLQTSLREFGINVPITPTSRKVCENKLKRLMGGDNNVNASDSISAQTASSVVSEELTPHNVVQFETREATPQLPPDVNDARHSLPSVQRRKQGNNKTESESTDRSDNEGETSVRELSYQERQLYQSRTQPHQSGGGSCKYVGLVLLLAVLVSFVVFLNRNAQAIDDEI